MSEQAPSHSRSPLELVQPIAPSEITYHREHNELHQLQAFVEAHSLPLLKAEQEISLAAEIKAGVHAQKALDAQAPMSAEEYKENLAWAARGKQAKLHFMHANFKLVAGIARQYYGSGLPLARNYGLMDMFNVGIIGLSKAVDKYDTNHTDRSGNPYRFSTMAVPWIKQEIIYEVRERGGTIRIPAETQQTMRKISRLRAAGLTNLEVQKILELNQEEMSDYTNFELQRDRLLSLDADNTPEDKGEATFYTVLPDSVAQTDFQRVNNQRGLEPGLKPGFSEVAGNILQLLRKFVNKQDNVLLDKIAAGETLFERDLKRQRAMSSIFEHPAVRPHLAALRPGNTASPVDWRDEAACKGKTELYATAKRFNSEERAQVQAICGSCAVRSACEAFFLEHKPERGRWIDGRTGAEFDPRRQMKKSARFVSQNTA